jgi:hypothetical protein
MIYQYLIPDLAVPGRRARSQPLRHDKSPVSTALFRVNKTIHEELADVFYGQPTFDIDVCNVFGRDFNDKSTVSMCFAKDESLLNYQVRLMGLEQLSQRHRVLDVVRQLSGPGLPSRPMARMILASGVKLDCTQWEPCLASRYFHRIRSFCLNITFHTPETSLWTNEVSMDEVETMRNMLCDSLHQVVDRLVGNHRMPLRNLDIRIRVKLSGRVDSDHANSVAITHCRSLLNPLRRLRTRIARTISLSRFDYGYEDVDLLGISRAADSARVRQFVSACRTELTKSPWPPPENPILVRFGQLAELVSQMSNHPFWRIEDLRGMEEVLRKGRCARESNDMDGMLSTFRTLFEILRAYHSSHQDFMKQITQSFRTKQLNGKLLSTE